MSAKKDFNKVNIAGTNRLVEEIERGNAVIVEQLIESGEADLDFRIQAPSRLGSLVYKVSYGLGASLLHVAAYLGHADIVRILVDKGGINPSVKDDGGLTPLDYAIISYRYYHDISYRKLGDECSSPQKFKQFFRQAESSEEMIRILLRAGGQPGLYAVPEELKAAPETKIKPPKI